MVSRSLRKLGVQKDTILMYSKTGSLPSGFTHECTLFNKYVRQVPTACTNPGSNVGATTHTHSSAGSHAHVHCPTTFNHAHTGTTDASSGTSGGRAGTGITTAPIVHTHSYTTSSFTPAITSQGGQGAHTHNAQNNDPLFITLRYIKKSSNVSMRKKGVPFNGIIMWPNTVATTPEGPPDVPD